MEEQKRGPGRPAKPELKMQKVKLLRGYVPSVTPAHITSDGVNMPKAAQGSVIEVPEDEAMLISRRRIAEPAFDSAKLDWITPKDRRERDSQARAQALEELRLQNMARLMAQRQVGGTADDY